MLKNYIKVALRNLQKQKTFALINVMGLSLGIACFILLLLFAANEFSFDKIHKNAKDIYRVYTLWNDKASGNPPVAYTDYSGPDAITLGESMKQNLPDVMNFVRLQLPWGENLIRTGDKVHRAAVTYADPSLFTIFDFPLEYGNPVDAMHDATDIVLTETRAKELFGTADAMGKTLEISIGGKFQPFRVTAVAKDMPANSTLRFDILGNYHFAQTNGGHFYIGSNWHPIVVQTYVQLGHQSRLPLDTGQLAAFLHTFDPNIVKNLKNGGWKGGVLPVTLGLQPLLAIHTDIGFPGWGFTDYGLIDPKTIWILLFIAAGILLIACINFTTLAIGRSAGRSKEVGVRKVIGAGKKQIVLQFLAEALLLTFASAILGLFLANSLLPSFNRLSGRHLVLSTALYSQMSPILTGVILIVGLLAGCYPAFVLSGFNAVEVLKNRVRVGGSNFFTKSLVTFQFALSIILIVSTSIIVRQTRYMVNKNPGFNKENVVAIDASETDPDKVFPLFKQALGKDPRIVGVASAAAGLGAGQDFPGFSDNGLSADINIIDSDYIRVMGMQLVAGKNLRPAFPNDSIEPIIINETMMNAFGWTLQNALGKEIRNFQGRTAVVAGVVRNFHYRPLGEPVKNQVFTNSTDKGFNHFYVRLNAGDPAPALTIMQKAWNSVARGVPMKYSFLDDDIERYYNAERKWSGMIGWAGGISIFLACLGLLGLAALAAVNRTKEIGVRKVLGASVPDIIALLSIDFLRLIVIAFVIASPLAWYFMNRWLQDYASRIEIGWTVFVLTGAFAMAIALITVGFQAVRAATRNPVRSLRTD